MHEFRCFQYFDDTGIVCETAAGAMMSLTLFDVSPPGIEGQTYASKRTRMYITRHGAL
jgi:hypothetical protein